MSKQHPESGSGGGKRAADTPVSAAKRSLSTAQAASPPKVPADGAVPRPRGRPSIGKPVQVRMTDAERDLATELGEGQLPKGVRAALNLLAVEQATSRGGLRELRQLLDALQALAKDEGMGQFSGVEMLTLLRRIRTGMLSQKLDAASRRQSADLKQLNLVPLSAKDADIATELGDGDTELGLRIALGAANFLGYDTARKLIPNIKPHGTRNSSK